MTSIFMICGIRKNRPANLPSPSRGWAVARTPQSERTQYQGMVRRIVVTGANKGIGLAVVKRCLLDYDDVHVVLACRSVERGNAAVEEISASNSGFRARTTVLEMDTGSDASVRAAAAKMAGQPLYAIVNNAGVPGPTLETVLNVNVYGPRRVDAAFIPLLDPKEGRIVQMSSGAAPSCVQKCSAERRAQFVDPTITWAQIDGLCKEVTAYPGGTADFESHGFSSKAMGGYGLSKALLNAYTQMLAREHPALKINACSPGFVATDIFGSALPWWLPIPNAMIRFITYKLMNAKTPDEGTVSTMHLLFSAALEGNGHYYGSDAQRSPLDKYRSPGSPPYDGS